MVRKVLDFSSESGCLRLSVLDVSAGFKFDAEKISRDSLTGASGATGGHNNRGERARGVSYWGLLVTFPRCSGDLQARQDQENCAHGIIIKSIIVALSNLST